MLLLKCFISAITWLKRWKWVIESSFIAECNDGFGTSRFRAPVVQRDFRNFISGCLVGREFCFLFDKVHKRKNNIFSGWAWRICLRHCGDGVEVCAQLTVFSVGGERLSDNLADVGLCRFWGLEWDQVIDSSCSCWGFEWGQALLLYCTLSCEFSLRTTLE